MALIEDSGVELPAEEQKYGITNRKSINSDTWEYLEKLYKGEGWPRSDSYVNKKFEELKDLHREWPDR